MKLQKLLFAVIAAALFAIPVGNASAELVTLNFGNTGNVGTDLDTNPLVSNLPFAVDAVDGLVLTVVSATGTGTGATLNSGSNFFGVNSDGQDQTARLEAALGESVTFSFNRDVDITRIAFNGLGGGEGIEVGGTAIAGGNDSVVFSEALSFSAGQEILFNPTAGSSVGIAAIEVRAAAAAVPEPSSALLLAMGAGALGLVRRRR